jgi:uncharacterized protein YhaN
MSKKLEVSKPASSGPAKEFADNAGRLLNTLKDERDPQRRERLLSSHIDLANNQIEALDSELVKANTEIARLNGVNSELQQKVDLLNALPDGIELRNLLTRASRAEANVRRLEKLCGLSGLDPSEAIGAVMGFGGSTKRDEIKDRLTNEVDPLKRGEIANELREFDQKHKQI